VGLVTPQPRQGNTVSAPYCKVSCKKSKNMLLHSWENKKKEPIFQWFRHYGFDIGTTGAGEQSAAGKEGVLLSCLLAAGSVLPCTTHLPDDSSANSKSVMESTCLRPGGRREKLVSPAPPTHFTVSRVPVPEDSPGSAISALAGSWIDA
jgi:hypothetical protein